MPNQINKRKNFRRYLIVKRIKKIISILVIIFLCIYIPTIIILATSSKPDLDMLHNGEIKDSIKAEGLVLKEEQLFTASFNGLFAKGASEGEKVPAGYTIASIVQKDYIDLFNQLESLKKEILLRKQSGEINSGIFTRDLKEVEESIKQNVVEITKAIYQDRLGDIDEYLRQISRYQQFRNDIIYGLSSNDIYVEDLENQAKTLEASFKSQIDDIVTEKPGIVTYNIDGFEDQYIIGDVINYSIDEFSQLLSNKTDNKNEGNEIIAGKPFVKMIYGNSYTLAFIISNDDVRRIQSKGTVSVSIEKLNLSIKSKNITYGNSDGENTIVFIEIDSKLNDLSSVRKISAEIVLSEYYGLKVQLSALTNLDAYPYQNTQLGVVKGNWVSFVDVEIVVNDDTYAIIESTEKEVSLYDYYVRKPEKVTEGQIVK
ncbi:MAG: hypothetical protein JXQ23_04135 [Clostridia bacterium]|nr:hypothetical protein [Clostridia bacterium]